MGTDAQPDSPLEWPWSALGIAPTADKLAIHAAHDAQRAGLNGAAARISEFADLTAAREKALFLAAEMRRQQAREGIPVVPPPAIDPPRPLAQALPEPEPEPEPEPDATEWTPGGRFASAEDVLATVPDDSLYPLPHFSDCSASPDEGETEWTHAGRYKPDLAQENEELASDLARLTGFDSPNSDAEGAWSGAGPTPFIQRYSLDKFGIVWLLAIFLLLAMCSAL